MILDFDVYFFQESNYIIMDDLKIFKNNLFNTMGVQVCLMITLLYTM